MRPLLLLLFLTACRETKQFTQETIEEIFCDGTTITAIVAREEIHASSLPMAHGSRYDERTRWTGAVRWSFPATPASGSQEPLRITALGSDHAEFQDDSGAHLPPIEHRAFLIQDASLHVDMEKGKLSLRRTDDPAAAASAEIDIDIPDLVQREALPTRSGRHLLATHRGTQLILSASDLQTVREIQASPGLVDFNKRFRGVEDHARLLTNDLRYLVKVPFNAGEPQGHNHCKAVVYDIPNDATHEIALTLGEGPTGIEDAESLDGELVFLAVYDGKLAVVDSSSTVLAWLPEEHFGTASLDSNLYWDPARKRIASWGQATFASLDPIRVSDHDYGTGETVGYELGWGETVEVLGGE